MRRRQIAPRINEHSSVNITDENLLTRRRCSAAPSHCSCILHPAFRIPGFRPILCSSRRPPLTHERTRTRVDRKHPVNYDPRASINDHPSTLLSRAHNAPRLSIEKRDDLRSSISSEQFLWLRRITIYHVLRNNNVTELSTVDWVDSVLSPSMRVIARTNQRSRFVCGNSLVSLHPRYILGH